MGLDLPRLVSITVNGKVMMVVCTYGVSFHFSIQEMTLSKKNRLSQSIPLMVSLLLFQLFCACYYLGTCGSVSRGIKTMGGHKGNFYIYK